MAKKDKKPDQTATAIIARQNTVAALSRYDADNAKKSGIGVAVDFTNGKTLLFGETARWRWKKIAGVLALEVEEHGAVSMQAWAPGVLCVTGPQIIFRDASWK